LKNTKLVTRGGEGPARKEKVSRCSKRRKKHARSRETELRTSRGGKVAAPSTKRRATSAVLGLLERLGYSYPKKTRLKEEVFLQGRKWGDPTQGEEARTLNDFPQGKERRRARLVFM